MKALHRCLAAVVVLASVTSLAHADGVLISWGVSTVEDWSKGREIEASTLSTDAMLSRNLDVKSWADAVQLMMASQSHKSDTALLDGLIAQVRDGTTTTLRGTRRLIIWERIASDEILFEGKGYQVADDLFRVAGRANWLLRSLTGHTFGYVVPSTTSAGLESLSERWLAWRRGQPVTEYANPFPSDKEGIAEIQSYAALEAMIHALAPSAEKDRLTRDCLKQVYKLDSLPTDESNPARLCNPDVYTEGLVRILTGIDGNHGSLWWAEWWATNRNRLVWNRSTGRFALADGE